MRRFKFAKIVRSKIVDDMKKMGAVPTTKELTKDETLIELFNQLKCEAGELVSAPKNKIVEEISDVLEVIDAIKSHLDVSDKDLNTVKEQKRSKVGDFVDGTYVEYIDVPDDYIWIDYSLKNSDRYPEIFNSSKF